MAQRSDIWWLPALVSALLLSPCLALTALYTLGGDAGFALWAGVVASAVVTAGFGLRHRGPTWAVCAFAVLAAAVATAAELAIYAGVS